jgi:hypothetical protein
VRIIVNTATKIKSINNNNNNNNTKRLTKKVALHVQQLLTKEQLQNTYLTSTVHYRCIIANTLHKDSSNNNNDKNNNSINFILSYNQ